MASPITRLTLSNVPFPERVIPSGTQFSNYAEDSAVFLGAWMSVENANTFVTKVNNTDKHREFPLVRIHTVNEHMNQEGVEKLALVYFNCVLTLPCSMRELHVGTTEHFRLATLDHWFHLYRNYVKEWLSYEEEPRQWLKELNIEANWSLWAYDELFTVDDKGYRHTRTIEFVEFDH